MPVGRPLVRVAYGTEFSEAVPVLRWHAWAVIFVFIGTARSQFLVNEGMTASIWLPLRRALC